MATAQSDLAAELARFDKFASSNGDDRVEQLLKLTKTQQTRMLAWMIVYLTERVESTERKLLDVLRLMELMTTRIEKLEKRDA